MALKACRKGTPKKPRYSVTPKGRMRIGKIVTALFAKDHPDILIPFTEKRLRQLREEKETETRFRAAEKAAIEHDKTTEAIIGFLRQTPCEPMTAQAVADHLGKQRRLVEEIMISHPSVHRTTTSVQDGYDYFYRPIYKEVSEYYFLA